jgi:hypothetical protein
MGGPGGTVERCTVILTPRDLFSVTEECLGHLFRNTPEPFLDRVVRYLCERMPSLATVRRRFTAWRVGYYREGP